LRFFLKAVQVAKTAHPGLGLTLAGEARPIASQQHGISSDLAAHIAHSDIGGDPCRLPVEPKSSAHRSWDRICEMMLGPCSSYSISLGIKSIPKRAARVEKLPHGRPLNFAVLTLELFHREIIFIDR
jgi:hypothetical protein